MQTIQSYINEKKTTGDGGIEMIKLMISELSKTDNKETWKSAEAFLTDYLNELSDKDIEYIIDALGIKDFKITSDRQAIANYIVYASRNKYN